MPMHGEGYLFPLFSSRIGHPALDFSNLSYRRKSIRLAVVVVGVGGGAHDTTHRHPGSYL